MPRDRRSCPSAQASVCETTVFGDDGEPVFFNPNDDKYLCLCGHAHCVTGVRLVICMLLFTLIVEFYELCVSFYVFARSSRWPPSSSTLVNLVLGGALTTCLIISLKFAKAAFLLPYLVMQAAGLIGTIVFSAASIYTGIFEDRKMAETIGVHVKGNENITLSIWLRAGTFSFMSAIQMWLISVVVGCWRYLRDLRRPHVAIDTAAADAVMHGLRRSVSAEIVERPRKHRLAGRSISVSLEKSVV